MAAHGRDEILGRVRTALANPALEADREPPPPAPLPARPDPRGLVERWRTELGALAGHVYGPLPHDAALDRLAEVALSLGAREVLAWEDAHAPVPGAEARLRERGMDVVAPTHERVWRPRYERVPLGVVCSYAGLADTGSIVVASGPGRARQASLLPPRMIALQRVADLWPDLPTWIAHQGAALMPRTANLVVITGPSRTADIELELVIGVHGPGEIHVVLVD